MINQEVAEITMLLVNMCEELNKELLEVRLELDDLKKEVDEMRASIKRTTIDFNGVNNERC